MPPRRASGGRSGGKGPPSGPSAPRAVLGGGGGPPLPGLAGGGEGPRREGIAGVDPQAWDPGTGHRGELPGGLPRGEAPNSPVYVTYKERGIRSGGGPRPVLGPTRWGFPGFGRPELRRTSRSQREACRGPRVSTWRQGGPGTAVGGSKGVNSGCGCSCRIRIRTKSTGDDLVEAPEDFFGNPIEPLGVQERFLRGGSWARSCSSHPAAPPGSRLLEQSIGMAITVMARGRRRRVRRRRPGRACRHACGRGSPPSKFLNLVQGL